MADITKNITRFQNSIFKIGGCAVVYLADLDLEEGGSARRIKVAVKVPFERIDRSNVVGDGMSEDRKLNRRRKREIGVWTEALHPNLLPFLGICHMSDISAGMRPHGAVGLVSPFCGGGSIVEYLISHPAVDGVYLLAQAAAAIQYLHSRNPPIIHGDIKGMNILIDDNGDVRLSDFGLSRILTSRGYTTDAASYSFRWAAIELLGIPHEGKNDQNGIAFSQLRTEASDIWAFGMTILEILTGKLPFSEVSSNEIFIIMKVITERVRPEKPPCSVISDAIWRLLETCWRDDPRDRPSAASLGLIWDLIHNYKNKTLLSTDNVSALLNWTANNSIGDITQYPHPHLPHIPMGYQHPYPCKWPNCLESFTTIDQCIEHECSDFVVWRAKNMPHKPAL